MFVMAVDVENILPESNDFFVNSYTVSWEHLIIVFFVVLINWSKNWEFDSFG